MSELFEKRFCSITGKKQSLDDLIDFPTDYSIKFMGLSEKIVLEDILKKIKDIVGQEVAKESVKIRQSSKGKYTSYTVKVYLKDADMLKSLYSMLKCDETVAYTL
jgi:putative lipoic acid-binding regulatory protein